MNTFELRIRDKTHRFSGPGKWAELSDAQAVALTRLRLTVQERPETLFVALRLLYGLKPRHQRWLFDESFLVRQGVAGADRDQILEQGQCLLDALLWIADEPAATFPQRFRRYDFHYGTPFVWVKRRLNRTLYAGPSSGMGDSTFEEFMFAYNAYYAEDRPLLAAILCRPLADGEREPFDRKTVERRAARFADLDPALLHRIAFGFGGTLRLLQRTFKHVFPDKPTSNGTNSDGPPGGKTGKAGSAWLDVAINMAKLDATKVGAIEQLNLYLALKVLDEQLRQADDLEQSIEKMKRK